MVMNETERLQTWLERGSVSISQLFFQFYNELQISDAEAMLIMHLNAFHEEGNEFPTPANIAQRMSMTENMILSPMETEMISMWLDQDGHSPEVIRRALKEAVLSQKLSLRYIDRILFEWKKNNVKTPEDAEKLSHNFRKNIIPKNTDHQPMKKETDQSSPTSNVPFYNWLDRHK